MIDKMMAICSNIENMVDLVKAHNLLVYVQEDMRKILTEELGEFTSQVFREINSLLDQSKPVLVNEILLCIPNRTWNRLFLALSGQISSSSR